MFLGGEVTKDVDRLDEGINRSAALLRISDGRETRRRRELTPEVPLLRKNISLKDFRVCDLLGWQPAFCERGMSLRQPGGTSMQEMTMRIGQIAWSRSEEHTSELQSLAYLVC